MINSRTLFIVGAGASTEAGLPTGSKLKDAIASAISIEFDDGFGRNQIRGSSEIVSALYAHAKLRDGNDRNINPYFPACRRICDAMPQAISIDNFLNDQRDDNIELCGKLAITHCILEAERNSLLCCDQHNRNAILNFQSLQNTWYNKFMQIITQGCHINEIENRLRSVSIITFNYDRCIEQFVSQWIRNYYNISEEEAENYMKSLDIIHPYGAVGGMRWQDSKQPTFFGETCGGERLLGLAGQIKTFTERVEEQSLTAKMRDLMRDSELVVFLGFAFHPQNMELITPVIDLKTSCVTKNILATAHSISDSDRRVVKDNLLQIFENTEEEILIEFGGKDLGCSEFFSEYWRTLAL